jgi:hypothetical protein
MFERVRNFELPEFRIPAMAYHLAPYVRRSIAPLNPVIARIKEATNPAIEAAKAWYEKRETREKLLLRLLGAVLAVLFIYTFIYSPILQLRSDLADRVSARRRDLLEVRGLARTYNRLKAQVAIAQKRTVAAGRNFSLFSVIEQTLTKSVGRDRIGSLTPTDRAAPGGFREYSVDVKLNGLSLPQIVDTLYGVQALALPVTVSDLQIHEHARDTHSYDVDMTCTALGRDG